MHVTLVEKKDNFVCNNSAKRPSSIKKMVKRKNNHITKQVFN